MKMILMILQQKSSHKNSIKKIPILMARLHLLSSRLLHSLFRLLRYKHLPCQDPLLWDHHLLHPYGLLGHLQAFLPDHLQGLLRS